MSLIFLLVGDAVRRVSDEITRDTGRKSFFVRAGPKWVMPEL